MENIFELKGKDPNGGLYIHLFQPKKDISEPGKNIKKGMSVIKPGSFKNTLSSRMRSYYSPKYEAAQIISAFCYHKLYLQIDKPEDHKGYILS